MASTLRSELSSPSPLRSRAPWCILIYVAIVFAVTPAKAQNLDESLKVYAVKVVKTTPFRNPTTGYGIYLGQGAVITAAHVIGRWGFLKNPRVLIAGQDLPATIVKEGSLEGTDITLLSIDETRLPVGIRLRRNPLCRKPTRIGEEVVVVRPEQTARSKIMSPQFIPSSLRQRFGTLISELAGTSGSGVFDARRRCLMGIISRAIQKVRIAGDDAAAAEPAGVAAYFVPAAEILDFLPADFRY